MRGTNTMTLNAETMRRGEVMETYREDAKCPKCLGVDVSVAWCRACWQFQKHDHDKERMHRTCQRCHYVWDEKPLDAEKPAPAKEAPRG